MGQVLVRNLPTEVIRRLQMRAHTAVHFKRNSRTSLSRQLSRTRKMFRLRSTRCASCLPAVSSVTVLI